LTNAQHAQTVADRTLLNKKVEVGLDYAVTKQGNDIAIAKQVIANVTTPSTPSREPSPAPPRLLSSRHAVPSITTWRTATLRTKPLTPTGTTEFRPNKAKTSSTAVMAPIRWSSILTPPLR